MKKDDRRSCDWVDTATKLMRYRNQAWHAKKYLLMPNSMNPCSVYYFEMTQYDNQIDAIAKSVIPSVHCWWFIPKKVESLILFLEAASHLYNRVCPSVRRSVRWPVRPSVGPSTGHPFVKNKGNQYFWANSWQRKYTRLNRCIMSIFIRRSILASVCQSINQSVKLL